MKTVAATRKGVGCMNTAPMLICAAVGVILLAGNIRGDAQTGHAVGPESVTNEYCPVLTDKKVDPEVFSDYEGKRVYFCCQACKAEFGENPEKYLGAAAAIRRCGGAWRAWRAWRRKCRTVCQADGGDNAGDVVCDGLGGVSPPTETGCFAQMA